MSLLDRLRPPARPVHRPSVPDVLRELTETAIDADAAVIGLVIALERRRDAVHAALRAGAINPSLGKRLLTKEAVDRGLHAAGLADHAGAPRPASSHRITFAGQVAQTLNAGKGERHGATE